jgi:hypothetical protein
MEIMVKFQGNFFPAILTEMFNDPDPPIYYVLIGKGPAIAISPRFDWHYKHLMWDQKFQGENEVEESFELLLGISNAIEATLYGGAPE